MWFIVKKLWGENSAFFDVKMQKYQKELALEKRMGIQTRLDLPFAKFPIRWCERRLILRASARP